MEYIDILKDKPRNREAVIINGNVHTYGELYDEAIKLRSTFRVGEKKSVFVIKEDGIWHQLLYFFACSGTKHVPLIVASDSKLSTGDDIFDIDVPDNSVMAVMTSGTTGVPKILFRDYESWGDFFPIQNEIFGIDADSRMFVQGSLAFTGNLNLYMGHLFAGGTIVAEDKFYPEQWESIILNNNVNTIYLIPSKLLLLNRVCKHTNDNIKIIISGSQSLGREDAERLKEIFPDVHITLYYGASELSYVTYVRDEDMTDERNLIGRPFPGVKVYVRNEEIYVDTPYHAEGVEVPCTLKDSGRMDEDGNLYFLGRTDDIVNIRGRKISMVKVENALMEIDYVENAAVVALPKTVADNEKNMEILTAYVKLSDDTKKSGDIKRLLAQRLSAYEIPKRFIYVDELPKNVSGKTDKKALMELWKKEHFK